MSRMSPDRQGYRCAASPSRGVGEWSAGERLRGQHVTRRTAFAGTFHFDKQLASSNLSLDYRIASYVEEIR